MNKKEVNNLIITGLSFCLKSDGFKCIKSQNQFSLNKDNFVYTISYHCVDRNPEYTIEFFLEIRNENVENIANRYSQSNPQFFKYSSTIIVRLSYFTGKLMKFMITSENDIKKIFNDFFNSFYKIKIQPFFEKYSSIEALAKLVNDSVSDEVFGIPTNIDLYQRNIILLKLTDSVDFENRVQLIREKISVFPNENKEMFENTYNYLKSL
jgi:hypothetical protein